MPLATGDRLGPYEILAKIGAGGMGEVYKARDTRLDRVVAVKTSKQQFTERFEREAKAVAQLNHPNVCTLHDVGPNFLVMEFVEGSPLKGPLPLDEVLRIAHQITAALEAAHEKHITHRDLKPANVMLKPDGQVKVLDFGLAKLAPPARTDLHPENSPTLTMSMTEAGMVVGTAAYMAPEQAKGINVDKRADIWAFGVVLYELLTGKRPFQGNDIAEILASVIKEQPSYDAVPFEMRRMIQRCLEKDPAKRLRDIGDVWDLLDKPEPSPPAPVMVEAKPSRAPWMIAAASTLAAAVVGWLYIAQPTPEPPPAVRLELTPPLPNPDMMLSPDGKSMMFIVRDKGIWIRSLDSPIARFLPGTSKMGLPPFWLGDSKSITFHQDGKLRRIDVAGGPATTLLEANLLGGASNRDGVIRSEGTQGPQLAELPPGRKALRLHR